MTVPVHRRELLKLAAGLPAALPMFTLAAGARGTWHAYPVLNQPYPATAGAVVLVDAGITRFAGAGFYLYPDWGRPVVYEVREKASSLAFHYPGNDRPLWLMSIHDPQARFSGRVEGLLSASCPGDAVEAFLAAGEWPVLEIPARVPA